MSNESQGRFSAVRVLFVSAGVALFGYGVLSIALPKFEQYQLQQKIAEVFVSAVSCRAEVSQAVQKASASELSRSLFACDGGLSAGVKISPHLKSLAVGDTGRITVTLDYRSLPALTPATNVLTLVPMVDGQTRLGVGDAGKTIAAWRCGSPMDGTTVPDWLLPSDCRG